VNIVHNDHSLNHFFELSVTVSIVLRGRQEPLARQQKYEPYDPDPYFTSHSLLGLYSVSSDQEIAPADKAFLEILTPGLEINSITVSLPNDTGNICNF